MSDMNELRAEEAVVKDAGMSAIKEAAMKEAKRC